MDKFISSCIHTNERNNNNTLEAGLVNVESECQELDNLILPKVVIITQIKDHMLDK